MPILQMPNFADARLYRSHTCVEYIIPRIRQIEQVDDKYKDIDTVVILLKIVEDADLQ